MKKKIFTLFILFNILFSPFFLKAENSILKQTGKAFTNVGKKATPAVVFIKASFTDNSTQADNYDPNDVFNDDFLKRFFGNPRFKQDQPQYAAGSGCIVSKDGYILTNNHIIKDANQITVTLNDGQEHVAKIIGADPKTDLAVIKIDAKNLPHLKFANSDDLEIGEWAIAIGAPFQLQSSLTVGVVSAKGRENLNITNYDNLIQTDAAINPGNSGGPLLDIDGNIIGINLAIISQSGGYMGIGFAIPSNMAKHIMDQIINNGSVNRGQLGVYLQPIDKEMSEALDLESAEGVLVADIIKNSAADKAGIKQGDIIISYNDIPVKNITSFIREISLMSPNDKVKLTVIRDTKKKNITVSLEQSSESKATTTHTISIGLEVSELKDISPEILKKWQYSSNIEGVIVTTVKNGSIAARSGIKPGMIIMQINNKKIANLDDFNNAFKNLDKKKHLLLLVKYQNITRFITIKLK